MARFENGCETGERRNSLDYETRIYSGLSLRKGKIDSFHLSLVKGAKPYTPKESDEARLIKFSEILLATFYITNQKVPNIGGNKLKNFDFELYKSSYVAIIDRECFFKVPISLHIKPSVYVIEKSSYFH